MNKIKLTALPCICADVFYGTEIIRPGGEALNFAAHASHFKDIDVSASSNDISLFSAYVTLSST